MAEALIKVKDVKGEVQLEVKFYPTLDNNSPAHQMVAEFVKSANLQEVKPAAEKAEG
jgi:hypothetical protein